ncbi:hypothetical protein LPB86_11780 [Pedobacter sp. MC2016-14]|uniref:HEPN domain-containing protein n=1 Tax=Pedobacter sp. MC2016-14 TaxID=2897327 RepID=UPI001E3F40E3|nr:HEPN domain-containing protein [Pedobacter sp. MC2016-14]MCD0488912.1 hypothetical protein [Pedobacter sp. MC2016-14]
MKIRIVAPIRHFQLAENFEFFIDSIRITNNPVIKNSLYSDQSFISEIGKISSDTIKMNHIFYFEGESSEIPFLEGLKNEYQMSRILCGFFDNFISTVWFIKDGGAHTNTCYVENLENKNYSIGFDNKNVFQNSRDTILSNSSGIFSPVLLNASECDRLKEIFKNILNVYQISVNVDDSISFKAGVTIPESLNMVDETFNRMERALLFLKILRKDGYIISKLTYYMALLESLFTFDNARIRETVSNRASKFIGGSNSTIFKNIENIKEAYKIRSNYIHGNINKKKPNEQIDLCKAIDEIVRQILLKILANDIPELENFSLPNTNENLRKFEKYIQKFN